MFIHRLSPIRPIVALKVLIQQLFFSIKRLWVLVFYGSAESFTTLATATEQGVWEYSYTDHLQTQKRVRFITSFASIAIAALITRSIAALFI